MLLVWTWGFHLILERVLRKGDLPSSAEIGGNTEAIVVILGQLDAESIFGFSPTMLGVTTPRGTGARWGGGSRSRGSCWTCDWVSDFMQARHVL